MRDVSEKNITLRIAVAQAIVEMPAAVLERLKARTLDKGDALEIARAAGILGAKRTWELLPLCHPLPVERLDLRYEFTGDTVKVLVEVGTHARTGVEMEALTAASIAALTLYDMLKPHAGTDLVIREILLLKKTGGKADFMRGDRPAL
jgi:cyclic pyranopterin phosphate synthase